MSERWAQWGPATADQASWVELSHVVRETVPKISYFPAPTIRRLKSMPTDPLDLTEIQMVCHVGTHVDAPSHLVPGAPAIDAVPLDRLVGPGVVVRLAVEADGLIDVGDLQAVDVRPDEILVLDTGWWRNFEDERYDRHPSLTVAAATWIVERGVKLLGLDFATPDLPVRLRSDGFDWPVHRILLSGGVLIAENLTNLDAVGTGRVEFMFLPLAIAGADGAPARVLARSLDPGSEP